MRMRFLVISCTVLVLIGVAIFFVVDPVVPANQSVAQADIEDVVEVSEEEVPLISGNEKDWFEQQIFLEVGVAFGTVAVIGGIAYMIRNRDIV